MTKQLRITEIFYSLQGETRTTGLPTVFVRLTGCPLRCQYCDTAYAFTGGTMMPIDDIMSQVQRYQPRYVTVSGGEPLAQPLCHDLLTLLCDQGFEVSLETSGALSTEKVDPRVIKVIDFKTPASLEMHRNDFNNVKFINPHDQVKFVICDEADYEWAKKIMAQYKLVDKCEVLFSPSYQQLAYQELADWIVADNLPVRFQVQLHKVLWGDVAGK